MTTLMVAKKLLETTDDELVAAFFKVTGDMQFMPAEGLERANSDRKLENIMNEMKRRNITAKDLEDHAEKYILQEDTHGQATQEDGDKAEV